MILYFKFKKIDDFKISKQNTNIIINKSEVLFDEKNNMKVPNKTENKKKLNEKQINFNDKTKNSQLLNQQISYKYKINVNNEKKVKLENDRIKTAKPEKSEIPDKKGKSDKIKQEKDLTKSNNLKNVKIPKKKFISNNELPNPTTTTINLSNNPKNEIKTTRIGKKNHDSIQTVNSSHRSNKIQFTIRAFFKSRS
jgi:hypothetical protein